MTETDAPTSSALPNPFDFKRPFRRAAGFFLVAVVLPVVGYASAVVFGGMPGYAAAVFGIPAIGFAIIALIHILAGAMLVIGSRHAQDPSP